MDEATLLSRVSRPKIAGNKWMELAYGDEHEAELDFMARLLVQRQRRGTMLVGGCRST